LFFGFLRLFGCCCCVPSRLLFVVAVTLFVYSLFSPLLLLLFSLRCYVDLLLLFVAFCSSSPLL
jgi:hypothetical protein